MLFPTDDLKIIEHINSLKHSTSNDRNIISNKTIKMFYEFLTAPIDHIIPLV